ncbi:RHS repeat-associated core domain-containing protein [Kitasatospora cineracea]|uniref:RHS repeat-associated core domain-containing protein n=1 Tax=Kitasatospora cineracea TaxID=88074 RepID=UPI0033D3C0F3
MSNQIVKALEHTAQKLGKTLAEDAGKALKGFYRKAGDNMRKVAKNTREIEEKHAKDLSKIMRGEGRDGVPHPRSGGGRRGKGGGSHPKGRGRDQVKSPRTEGRPEESRCPGGEPVDMATGRMFTDESDVRFSGSLPLEFTRSFDSGLLTGRWMGPKWLCPFDERLEIDADGLVHVRPDRITQSYPHPEPGDPVHPLGGAVRELDLMGGLFTVTEPATGLIRTFTRTSDGDEALLTEVRDRHGRHYTLAYDEDGVPLSITHSGGHRLLVTVDNDRITALRLAGAGDNGGDALLTRYGYTDGHLTVVYNSSGTPMRYANDGAGRILSWTDRVGTRYGYTYDALDRAVEEGSSDGTLRFTFRYDEPDPVTGLRRHHETDALGRTTVHHVNEHAQVVAQTDPLGRTTRFERDEHDALLSRTDPLGRTTRFVHDGAGDLVETVRPDGGRSTFEYAGALSLPTTVTAPGGAVWRQEYDENGLCTSTTDPVGAVTQFTYDERGHATSVTDALGHTTRVTCDAAGMPIEVTAPDGSTTVYERDAFGRVVTVVDPAGGVTRLTWTVEGLPATRTAPDGSSESRSYDDEGNLVRYTDALGQVTAYEYTHLGTMTARTEADGSRYTFEHDAKLRLVGVTGPNGRRWSYRYDEAGQLVGETDFGGRTVEYAYDAGGQLTAVVNPAGERITFGYDLLGRTIAKDAAGRITTYSYDGAGHLVRATNPDADLVRTVDPLGRLLTETVNGRTLRRTLDPLGRTTARTTPFGHASAWSYDAAGYPTNLVTPEGTIDFAYDGHGQETCRSVGGLTLSTEWDGNHRLTGRTLRTGQSVLQRRDYTYRPDGRLTAVEDLLAGRRSIDLDAVGRVTAVHAATFAERYAYDPEGNITDADWPTGNGTGAAVGPRTYADGRLTSAGRVRYEYDGAGRTVLRQKARLSSKPDTWRYAWDPEDRLTHVTTPDGDRWRYLYDPLGRRIAKQRLGPDGTSVIEQTEFTWDGATLVEQTTTAPYLPGPHTLTWDHRGLHPLAQREAIGGGPDQVDQEQVDRRFFAIVTDLVGTPTELVDPLTDSIAWRATPTLWGHTTWPSESTTYTPLRFPGQYFDPETRLHYNVHRYYDPETGRYASPDPLGLAPAPNPEVYVRNPLQAADPLGLAEDDGLEWVDPSDINFSQRTVSPNDYAGEMAAGRWNWNESNALRVIEVNGQLVSYDNRRLDAAREAGVRVPIARLDPNSPYPASTTGLTWQEAFDRRFRDPRNRLNGRPVPPHGLSERPQQVSCPRRRRR